MQPEKTVTAGVRMPPSLRDRLRQIASAERRTLSQMCLILIEEALAARERGHASK